MQTSWFTIPNALSVSRIVFLPLLVALAWFEWRLAFTIGYLLIGSTDAFDGYIARKFNQVSEFGKTIDSLADVLFYVASAWFLHRLYPEYLEPNQILLFVFFGIFALSFIVSAIRLGVPVMMHTHILRYNAVLVYALMFFSFFFNTTLLVAVILGIYILGFIEEILIFLIFGDVDRDTTSILALMSARKNGSR